MPLKNRAAVSLSLPSSHGRSAPVETPADLGFGFGGDPQGQKEAEEPPTPTPKFTALTLPSVCCVATSGLTCPLWSSTRPPLALGRCLAQGLSWGHLEPRSEHLGSGGQGPGLRSMSFFSFKSSLILLDTVTERVLPSAGSLPIGLNSQSWASPYRC